MATKRRLINPQSYNDTLDEAMGRLKSIEDAILKNNLVQRQEQARTQDLRRRVIRKGFIAGSGPDGWHEGCPRGREWLLKRITVIYQTVNYCYVMVGNMNSIAVSGGSLALPTTVREVCPVTSNFNYWTDGTVGAIYSDAFDNDIYVRGGEEIYLGVTTNLAVNASVSMYATLEVEEFVPVERYITEAENLSQHVANLDTERDELDLDAVGYSGDRPQPEEHYPIDPEDDGEPLTDDDMPDVQKEQPLIPDVAAHLPPNLRSN